MNKKVLILGSDGLVGSAFKNIGQHYMFSEFDLFFTNRQEGDLTKEKDCKIIFQKYKPDYLINCAARVGGIGRNLNSPVQQFNDNILINTNIIKQAHLNEVQKLIAFSSVCVFPTDAKVLKEDIMHDGPPFSAHWSYAMSKRMV